MEPGSELRTWDVLDMEGRLMAGAFGLATLLMLSPGASAADWLEACANERQLLCPKAPAGPELEACLRRKRRGLMSRCRAAFEGKETPKPSPAPQPKPALPSAESRRRAAKSFLNVDLPRADGSGKVWMAGCPTEKCLTIFLAPWCPHCRAARPAILALKAHLKERGVETRIVVGKDKPDPIKAFAAELGTDCLLDPDWEFRFSGGLPHFFVSRDGGEVILARPGILPNEAPEKAAARFGLP